MNEPSGMSWLGPLGTLFKVGTLIKEIAKLFWFHPVYLLYPISFALASYAALFLWRKSHN